MVIGIIGESCTGKSTLAQKIQIKLGGEVFTGKDYMRLAKNEQIAKKIFCEKLENSINGENIIYVISEKEHLSFLPDEAIRILVTAELEAIKDRFSLRMHGNLPAPVAKMLEEKHGMFDGVKYDFHVVAEETNIDDLCEQISLAKNN